MIKKTILILSGPTHEYIDPVRFIGNASSGLMGKAIAEEALRRKYAVEFVTGPVPSQNLPNNVNLYEVVSARDMLATATQLFPQADIIVFAAAVADYAPVEYQKEKMTKTEDELVLRLRPNPDIAKTLCTGRRNTQTAIGFALQTFDGENRARRKLEEKNLDGIVLNTPASFGADTGTFSFLSKNADGFEDWGSIEKTTCARKIFDAIE
jgi:phosphopantothenoylcysteine decarboxylase/phosphopantothenate--cysteine ligase